MANITLKALVKDITEVNGLTEDGSKRLFKDLDKYIDQWFELNYNKYEQVAEHGEWVCPNYSNKTALPNEDNLCSLCFATLVPGYPEQKGND